MTIKNLARLGIFIIIFSLTTPVWSGPIQCPDGIGSHAGDKPIIEVKTRAKGILYICGGQDKDTKTQIPQGMKLISEFELLALIKN